MTSRVAQRQAERAKQRIVLELENRTMMLCIHGFILLVLGLMMALTGAPAPTEAWYGPWSRLVVGGIGILIGLTILVGVALTDESPRGYVSQVVGTLLAALWHLGLSSTYAFAAITERMELLAPGEPLSVTVTNRGYIPFVYLGYVMLISLHARTLIKLGRPPR
jgi:hypothetical protein